MEGKNNMEQQGGVVPSRLSSEGLGEEIIHLGVKGLIGEMRGKFSNEENQEINSKVINIMDSDFPTVNAVEAAVKMPDNNQKILFLAIFSDMSVSKALQGLDHEEGSADRFAGFYMDSLGEMILRETQKRQELPPPSPNT